MLTAVKPFVLIHDVGTVEGLAEQLEKLYEGEFETVRSDSTEYYQQLLEEGEPLLVVLGTESGQEETLWCIKAATAKFAQVACAVLAKEPTGSEVISYYRAGAKDVVLYNDLEALVDGQLKQWVVRREKEQHQLVVDALNGGFWDWDMVSGKVYYSKRWIDAFGYTEDMVEPTIAFWEGTVHPEDMPEVQRKLQEHAEGKTERFEHEYRMLRGDGTYVWNRDTAKVVERAADGSPRRAIGCNTDISEQKRAEDKLASVKKQISRVEDNFQKVFENASMGVSITTYEGDVLLINDFALGIFGSSEATQMDLVDSNPYVNPEEREELVKDLKQYGSVTNREVEMQVADGKRIWLSISARAIHWEGQEAFLSTFLDVSNTRKAHELLVASEERFRSFFEQSVVPSLIFNTDGFVIEVNRAWQEMWDVKDASEVLGKYNLKQDPQLKQLGLISELEKAFEGQDVFIPDVVFDPAHSGYPGRKRHLRMKAFPVINNGKVSRVVVFNEDVTSEVETQNDLEQSELRLREAQAVARIGSFEGDIYKDQLWWSDELFNLFGLNPKEFVMTKDKFEALLHPEDREPYMAALNRSLEVGGLFKREFRGKHISGEWKCFETFARVTQDAEGNVSGLQGTVQDVTERKEKNEQLAMLTERLQLALEIAELGYLEMKPLEDKLHWDLRLKEIFEWKEDDSENLMEYFYSIMHPEDKERVQERFRQSMDPENEETKFRNEFRLLFKDGRVKHVELNAVHERNVDGEVTQVNATCLDVTERKQADEELLRSAERFERWKASNFVGILQSNGSGEIIDANDTILEMLGYTREELKEGKLDWKKLTPPEFVSLDVKASEEAKKNGYWTPYEKEYLHKYGHRIPILLGGAAYDAKFDQYIAFVVDLTDSKRAQRRIKSSEERLKILFESAPDAYYIRDMEGHFMDCNRAAEQLLGYGREELIGKSFFELGIIDLKDVDKAKADIADRLVSKSYAPTEYNLVRKDKSKVAVEALAHPVVMEGRSVVLGIVRDISARKETERELKKMGVALQQSPAMVVITDPEGNLEYINPKFEEITGYNFAELQGKNLRFLRSTQTNAEEYEALWKTITAGEVWTGEVQNRKKDGSLYWERASVGPVFDGRNRITHFVAVKEDITALKKAEQNLINTLNLTTEQNKRLQNFSYIVSHNLRSHSSNISGILGLLESAATDQERERLQGMLKTVASKLDETMYHLNDAVNTLVDKDLFKEALSLRYYLDSALDVLSDEISHQKVLVENLVSIDTSVCCNTAYLDSILLNILSNAIKYASPDRSPRIRITSMVKNEDVELSIADNGVGIDLKRHGASLFGMYKTFHGNKDARGIGLFICKNQLESMGGSIRVESKVGEGSTFILTFKHGKMCQE